MSYRFLSILPSLIYLSIQQGNFQPVSLFGINAIIVDRFVHTIFPFCNSWGIIFKEFMIFSFNLWNRDKVVIPCNKMFCRLNANLQTFLSLISIILKNSQLQTQFLTHSSGFKWMTKHKNKKTLNIITTIK